MSFLRLELRHLRTLCAIADAGSLGRAAAVLGYSQPALSTQLRRLEQLLGDELFTRGGAGTEPTLFGQEVLDQARDILSRVDALGRRPTARSVPDGVPLRLGATITPVLPGLMTRIRAGFPEVAVTVTSEYAIDALLKMLSARVIDVALVLDYPGRELCDSDEIACRAFATEPAFVALPSGHPLAQRMEVSLAELAQEAWFITPDDGAGWPGVFYDACERAGFRPAQTHEFLDELNLPGLIAAGVAITVCQPTINPVFGIVVKPLRGSPIGYRQLLAWHRDGPAAPLAPALHRFATATYRELVARSPHYHAWRQRQAP
ncbi:LysR family transcriptional regulator [Longispora sp. K20-0274]|uniref:LysR substrate-binding domain-containing protein n=1 Tax=Longispora sp. K20-0274 TaxID=3088255 RepID=UPI00399971B4